MNKLDELISAFERFPGIGARQARRFAFHVLTLSSDDAARLSELILGIRGTVIECQSCRRFFARSGGDSRECPICADQNRDRSKLLIVERDSDVQSIERSGVYDGLYFVLGGTVPLLSVTESNIRSGALKSTVERRSGEGLAEIILGFAVNPDGENTGRYVSTLLKEFIEAKQIRVSELGRGLSTGSELEYADPETIKNALINRH
jgi:recombination protein RecR